MNIHLMIGNMMEDIPLTESEVAIVLPYKYCVFFLSYFFHIYCLLSDPMGDILCKNTMLKPKKDKSRVIKSITDLQDACRHHQREWRHFQ